MVKLGATIFFSLGEKEEVYDNDGHFGKVGMTLAFFGVLILSIMDKCYSVVFN